MILKKNKKYKKKNTLNLIYKYYFYSTIIITILLGFFFFNSGIWQMYKNKAYDRINLYGFKNYLYLPKILYFSVKGFFKETDKIYLDLNYNQIIKLEKNRADKIEHQRDFMFPYELGGGFPFNYKWSNGSINLNDGNSDKIKIRLKGARSIHWKDEKYSSYRVRIKGDKKIYGADTFSLQKPRARNYLHEWIFHKLCNELGLVTLNYNFINLIKNGENKGLYVFEESFSNELVERNKRRNGPILSLDEKISVNFKNSEIDVYDRDKWQHLSITKVASKKLENFFQGKSNAIEHIDMDLWAKYFAIVDLTQTFHGLLAKSVKFFYNPVSGLIEPIGFDGHYFPLSKVDGSKASNKGRYFDLLIEISNKNDNYQKNFINLFLSNEEFNRKYFFYLNEISNEIFLDNFFKKYEKQIDENLSLIYSDYFLNDHAFFFGPGIYYFNEKDYYNRANLIQRKIKVYKDKIRISLDGNKLKIKNHNLNKNIQPIKVKCLSGDYIFQYQNINQIHYFEHKSIDINNTCDEIIFENYLTKKNLKKNINYHDNQDFELTNINNFSEKLLNYFEKIDNKLYFKNKTTKIDHHLYIPSIYTVELKPNQEIILNNGAFIFSKANWIYENKDKKIKIYSEDINNKGGGIFIFNNKNPTILNNLEFFNLGVLDRESINNYEIDDFMSNYNLLGSLNFYKTSVKISNSKFFNIQSEDAVNIINSNFNLENVIFDDIKYDAIDFDFTIGKLSNLKFKNIGNDAVDFSGSNVEVNNIFGSDINDKFISVGEKSEIKVNKGFLIKSNIGIASKDGSKVLAKNIDFKDVIYPFASYRKKNEYSGGKLDISKFKIKNYKSKFLMDQYSEIKLDQKKQNYITKNILNLIY